jgi:hypothetical protein
MLTEWTIKEWCIMFFANQPQEVGQEVDPNPDGETVCMVI